MSNEQIAFQSTRPVRDATYGVFTVSFFDDVSIHAPRAGRDHQGLISTLLASCFNPRAPCGTRPIVNVYATSITWFQSTRPVRERDYYNPSDVTQPNGFQSTRPVRDATSS